MVRLTVTYEQFVDCVRKAGSENKSLQEVCNVLGMKLGTARVWYKELSEAGVVLPKLARQSVKKQVIDVAALNARVAS